MFTPSDTSTPDSTPSGGSAIPLSPLPFQLGAAHLASTRALNQQLDAANAVRLALDEIDAQLAMPQNSTQLGVLQLARADAVEALRQSNLAVNQALQTALTDSDAFLMANAAPSAADDYDYDCTIAQLPDKAAMTEGSELPDHLPQGLSQELSQGVLWGHLHFAE